MAAAKPLVVVIAFRLLAVATAPLPDGGGGELPPFPLHPAEQPPGVSVLPDSGGGKNLPQFTLIPSADPAAATAGCGGPTGGTCSARDEALGLGTGAKKRASTMSVDPERGRRIVHHQQRDSVPCSRRGASYYNCRSGEQANPYRRSCTRIKQCRG